MGYVKMRAPGFDLGATGVKFNALPLSYWNPKVDQVIKGLSWEQRFKIKSSRLSYNYVKPLGIT